MNHKDVVNNQNVENNQQPQPLKLKINNVYVCEFEILQIKDASDMFVNYYRQDIVNQNIQELQNEIQKLKEQLENND